MIEKYRAIFKLSCIQSIKNYKELIGLTIFLMTCLVIFSHLWKVAIATTSGAKHFQPTNFLWYITLNEWLLTSIPYVHDSMEEDVQSGRISYLIVRPISYLGATFVDALGSLTIHLVVLGISAFLFAWLQTGSIPFHLLFVVQLFFVALGAGIVAILFQMMIGLSSFWIQDISPLYWVWEKMLFMLGGLMLPLSLYPNWIQKLAHVTPFPSILGDRSALVLDNSHMLSVTLTLLGWIIVGIGGLVLLYRRSVRLIQIEGG